MTLFFHQLIAELYKMFARKRTWIGFAGFIALEAIVVTMCQLPQAQAGIRKVIEKSGGTFHEYFSGPTMAFLILLFTSLLGLLFLALVAGDIVAKDVEDGTMRMTLTRPVSRLRVLTVKFLATMFYTFVLVAFIAASAMLTGWLWRGSGGMIVFVPEEKYVALIPPAAAVGKFAVATCFFALSLTTISAMAFFFSCLNAKPAAATVLALLVMLVDRLLRDIPFFEAYRDWFITTHSATWLNALSPSIPWDRMAEDYLYLAGINGTLFILGAVAFCRRDFKS